MNKTPEANLEISSVEPGSPKAGEFVLCHFSHAGDLLFGIDALKAFHIPIQEVYTPVRIKGLRSRLSIKKLRLGHAFLTYGCFGGLAATSLIGYALGHQGHVPPLLVLLAGFAFAFAFWFTIKPPKIIRLPPHDRRFLIVIKTRNIIPTEGIACFLQYSGSVEITQAVKKMLLN